MYAKAPSAFAQPGWPESARSSSSPKALDMDFLDKFKQKSRAAKKDEKKGDKKTKLVVDEEIITEERTSEQGLVLKPSRVVLNYKKSVAFVSPDPGGLPGPKNVQMALISMHRQASNEELERQMLAYDESYYKNYVLRKKESVAYAKFVAKINNIMFTAGTTVAFAGSLYFVGIPAISYVLQSGFLGTSYGPTALTSALEMFLNLNPTQAIELKSALTSLGTTVNTLTLPPGNVFSSATDLFAKAFNGKNPIFDKVDVNDLQLGQEAGAGQVNLLIPDYQKKFIEVSNLLIRYSTGPFLGPMLQIHPSLISDANKPPEAPTPAAAAAGEDAELAALWKEFGAMTGMTGVVDDVKKKGVALFLDLLKKRLNAEGIPFPDPETISKLIELKSSGENVLKGFRSVQEFYTGFTMQINNVYAMFDSKQYEDPNYIENYGSGIITRLRNNTTMRGAFLDKVKSYAPATSWFGEEMYKAYGIAWDPIKHPAPPGAAVSTAAPPPKDDKSRDGPASITNKIAGKAILFIDNISPNYCMGYMGNLVYDELSNTVTSGLQSIFPVKQESPPDEDVLAAKKEAEEKYEQGIRDARINFIKQGITGDKLTNLMIEMRAHGKGSDVLDSRDMNVLEYTWKNLNKKITDLRKRGVGANIVGNWAYMTIAILGNEVLHYKTKAAGTAALSGVTSRITGTEIPVDIWGFTAQPIFDMLRNSVTADISVKVARLLQELHTTLTSLYQEAYNEYVRKPIMKSDFVKNFMKWKNKQGEWISTAILNRLHISAFIQGVMGRMIDSVINVFLNIPINAPLQAVTEFQRNIDARFKVSDSFNPNQWKFLLDNVSQENMYGCFSHFADAAVGEIDSVGKWATGKRDPNSWASVEGKGWDWTGKWLQKSLTGSVTSVGNRGVVIKSKLALPVDKMSGLVKMGSKLFDLDAAWKQYGIWFTGEIYDTSTVDLELPGGNVVTLDGEKATRFSDKNDADTLLAIIVEDSLVNGTEPDITKVAEYAKRYGIKLNNFIRSADFKQRLSTTYSSMKGAWDGLSVEERRTALVQFRNHQLDVLRDEFLDIKDPNIIPVAAAPAAAAPAAAPTQKPIPPYATIGIKTYKITKSKPNKDADPTSMAHFGWTFEEVTFDPSAEKFENTDSLYERLLTPVIHGGKVREANPVTSEEYVAQRHVNGSGFGPAMWTSHTSAADLAKQRTALRDFMHMAGINDELQVSPKLVESMRNALSTNQILSTNFNIYSDSQTLLEKNGQQLEAVLSTIPDESERTRIRKTLDTLNKSAPGSLNANEYIVDSRVANLYLEQKRLKEQIQSSYQNIMNNVPSGLSDLLQINKKDRLNDMESQVRSAIEFTVSAAASSSAAGAGNDKETKEAKEARQTKEREFSFLIDSTTGLDADDMTLLTNLSSARNALKPRLGPAELKGHQEQGKERLETLLRSIQRARAGNTFDLQTVENDYSSLMRDRKQSEKLFNSELDGIRERDAARAKLDKDYDIARNLYQKRCEKDGRADAAKAEQKIREALAQIDESWGRVSEESKDDETNRTFASKRAAIKTSIRDYSPQKQGETFEQYTKRMSDNSTAAINEYAALEQAIEAANAFIGKSTTGATGLHRFLAATVATNGEANMTFKSSELDISETATGPLKTILTDAKAMDSKAAEYAEHLTEFKRFYAICSTYPKDGDLTVEQKANYSLLQTEYAYLKASKVPGDVAKIRGDAERELHSVKEARRAELHAELTRMLGELPDITKLGAIASQIEEIDDILLARTSLDQNDQEITTLKTTRAQLSAFIENAVDLRDDIDMRLSQLQPGNLTNLGTDNSAFETSKTNLLAGYANGIDALIQQNKTLISTQLSGIEAALDRIMQSKEKEYIDGVEALGLDARVEYYTSSVGALRNVLIGNTPIAEQEQALANLKRIQSDLLDETKNKNKVKLPALLNRVPWEAQHEKDVMTQIKEILQKAKEVSGFDPKDKIRNAGDEISRNSATIDGTQSMYAHFVGAKAAEAVARTAAGTLNKNITDRNLTEAQRELGKAQAAAAQAEAAAAAAEAEFDASINAANGNAEGISQITYFKNEARKYANNATQTVRSMTDALAAARQRVSREGAAEAAAAQAAAQVAIAAAANARAQSRLESATEDARKAEAAAAAAEQLLLTPVPGTAAAARAAAQDARNAASAARAAADAAGAQAAEAGKAAAAARAASTGSAAAAAARNAGHFADLTATSAGTARTERGRAEEGLRQVRFHIATAKGEDTSALDKEAHNEAEERDRGEEAGRGARGRLASANSGMGAAHAPSQSTGSTGNRFADIASLNASLEILKSLCQSKEVGASGRLWGLDDSKCPEYAQIQTAVADLKDESDDTYPGKLEETQKALNKAIEKYGAKRPTKTISENDEATRLAAEAAERDYQTAEEIFKSAQADLAEMERNCIIAGGKTSTECEREIVEARNEFEVARGWYKTAKDCRDAIKELIKTPSSSAVNSTNRRLIVQDYSSRLHAVKGYLLHTYGVVTTTGLRDNNEHNYRLLRISGYAQTTKNHLSEVAGKMDTHGVDVEADLDKMRKNAADWAAIPASQRVWEGPDGGEAAAYMKWRKDIRCGPENNEKDLFRDLQVQIEKKGGFGTFGKAGEFKCKDVTIEHWRNSGVARSNFAGVAITETYKDTKAKWEAAAWHPPPGGWAAAIEAGERDRDETVSGAQKLHNLRNKLDGSAELDDEDRIALASFLETYNSVTLSEDTKRRARDLLPGFVSRLEKRVSDNGARYDLLYKKKYPGPEWKEGDPIPTAVPLSADEEAEYQRYTKDDEQLALLKGLVNALNDNDHKWKENEIGYLKAILAGPKGLAESELRGAEEDDRLAKAQLTEAEAAAKRATAQAEEAQEQARLAELAAAEAERKALAVSEAERAAAEAEATRLRLLASQAEELRKEAEAEALAAAMALAQAQQQALIMAQTLKLLQSRPMPTATTPAPGLTPLAPPADNWDYTAVGALDMLAANLAGWSASFFARRAAKEAAEHSFQIIYKVMGERLGNAFNENVFSFVNGRQIWAVDHEYVVDGVKYFAKAGQDVSKNLLDTMNGVGSGAKDAVGGGWFGAGSWFNPSSWAAGQWSPAAGIAAGQLIGTLVGLGTFKGLKYLGWSTGAAANAALIAGTGAAVAVSIVLVGGLSTGAAAATYVALLANPFTSLFAIAGLGYQIYSWWSYSNQLVKDENYSLASHWASEGRAAVRLALSTGIEAQKLVDKYGPSILNKGRRLGKAVSDAASKAGRIAAKLGKQGAELGSRGYHAAAGYVYAAGQAAEDAAADLAGVGAGLSAGARAAAGAAADSVRGRRMPDRPLSSVFGEAYHEAYEDANQQARKYIDAAASELSAEASRLANKASTMAWDASSAAASEGARILAEAARTTAELGRFGIDAAVSGAKLAGQAAEAVGNAAQKLAEGAAKMAASAAAATGAAAAEMRREARLLADKAADLARSIADSPAGKAAAAAAEAVKARLAAAAGAARDGLAAAARSTADAAAAASSAAKAFASPIAARAMDAASVAAQDAAYLVDEAIRLGTPAARAAAAAAIGAAKTANQKAKDAVDAAAPYVNAAGRVVASGAQAVGSAAASGAQAVGAVAAPYVDMAVSGAQAVGSAAVSGAQAVGSVAASAAQTVGSAAASGAQAVGSAAASGAQAVGSAAASAAQTVGSAAASGARVVGSAAGRAAIAGAEFAVNRISDEVDGLSTRLEAFSESKFMEGGAQSGGAHNYIDIYELISIGKAPIAKELYEIAIITANTSVAIMSASSSLLKNTGSSSEVETKRTISTLYDECVYVVDKSTRIIADAEPVINRKTDVGVDKTNINIVSIRAAVNAATAIVENAESLADLATESVGPIVVSLVQGTRAATKGVIELTTMAIISAEKSLVSVNQIIREDAEILLAQARTIRYRADNANALADAALSNGTKTPTMAPVKTSAAASIVSAAVTAAAHIETPAAGTNPLESLRSGLGAVQKGIDALSDEVNRITADRPTNLFDKSDLCPLVDPNQMEAIYIRNKVFAEERIRLVIERIEERTIRTIISDNLKKPYTDWYSNLSVEQCDYVYRTYIFPSVPLGNLEYNDILQKETAPQWDDEVQVGGATNEEKNLVEREPEYQRYKHYPENVFFQIFWATYPNLFRGASENNHFNMCVEQFADIMYQAITQTTTYITEIENMLIILNKNINDAKAKVAVGYSGARESLLRAQKEMDTYYKSLDSLMFISECKIVFPFYIVKQDITAEPTRFVLPSIKNINGKLVFQEDLPAKQAKNPVIIAHSERRLGRLMSSPEFEPYLKRRKQTVIAKKFSEKQKVIEIEAAVKAELAFQKEAEMRRDSEIAAAQAAAEEARKVAEAARAEEAERLLAENKEAWRRLQRDKIAAAKTKLTDAEAALDTATKAEMAALNALHQAQFEAKIHLIISEICLENYPKKRLGIAGFGSSYCDTKIKLAESANIGSASANGIWRTAASKRDRLYKPYIDALTPSVEANKYEDLFLAKLFEQEQERLLSEGVIKEEDIEENRKKLKKPDAAKLKKITDIVERLSTGSSAKYRKELETKQQGILAKLERREEGGVRWYTPSGGALPTDDKLDEAIATLAKYHGFAPFKTARGSVEELQKDIEAKEDAERAVAQKVIDAQRVKEKQPLLEEVLSGERLNEFIKNNILLRNKYYIDVKVSYHAIIQAYFEYFVTKAIYSQVTNYGLGLERSPFKSEYTRKREAFEKAEAAKNQASLTFENNKQILKAQLDILDGYKVKDDDTFKRDWVKQMGRDLKEISTFIELKTVKMTGKFLAPFQSEIQNEYEEVKQTYDVPDENINEIILRYAELFNTEGAIKDKKLFSNKVIQPYEGLVAFDINKYQPPRPAPVKGALGLGFFGLGGSRKVRRDSSRKTLKQRRTV